MNSLLIISIVFSALYFVMVLYFFIGWLRLPQNSELKTQNSGNSLPFVSVVIPVRNESENISACLESIFKQNYPAELFEAIVIDDYSTDTTLPQAREFDNKNLTVIDLQQYLGNPGEYSPNKKKAIALGVKNAKGELIVTTDGDCVMSENWIRTMAVCFTTHDYKLMTGPVMIKPVRSPMELFQQLDVMSLSGVTGGTIRNKMPAMSNGANLMYSKEAFTTVEGFKGNHDSPTGDDIFLMQKIHARYPGSIGFAKSYEACVFTRPEKGLRAFFSQRMRWVSKSQRLSDFRIRFILYFIYFFNLLILVAAVCAFLPGELSWLPVAVAGGAKLFSDFIILIPVSRFFRKMVLLLLLPVTEVIYIFYILLTGILSLGGRYRWKDRLIR